MRRRHAAIAVAAAGGAAAGAGVAWWRKTAPPPGVHRDPEAAGPATAADFWSLAFVGLDGASVGMADWRGRPLLVNFWATWCAPCVVELPLLDAFWRGQQRRGGGWRVLALAIDGVDKVRSFAASRQLGLPIATAGGEGLAVSRALGNAAGGLPFTVVFDSAGDVAQRKLGTIDQPLLDLWSGGVR